LAAIPFSDAKDSMTDSNTAAFPGPYKSVTELAAAPEEYRLAIRKIVRSHAVNELYGAQVFDEPAIALAPTPYAKWLTCRVAMEEYGHHVRFRELGEQIGIPAEEMTPQGKKPLSIFAFDLASWEEFCVIKLLADLAEILQVEDLLHCTFHPLRNLARMTMPEERFHAQFGKEFCTELCRTPEGRARVQQAIDRIFPGLPAFFGRSESRNNELYRAFGIKQRSNDAMRADYIERARALVEQELGLSLPAAAKAA
jgi:ring-1,2-phenylacetyl-CoA epoxidase subunit PaaA